MKEAVAVFCSVVMFLRRSPPPTPLPSPFLVSRATGNLSSHCWEGGEHRPCVGGRVREVLVLWLWLPPVEMVRQSPVWKIASDTNEVPPWKRENEIFSTRQETKSLPVLLCLTS
ncbi:hypothetical protein SKAU_G00163990 [Synaphobranchus kaupii]|uniref:Uncharacterized protein n=1 Tax=Synaphobranchus kaupii TaxID=118154 RepID=A0A9Q1FJI5_SYNKA|nr:hypothetical protein SKAU_G00163990 [Synaphobranchus kaupii]